MAGKSPNWMELSREENNWSIVHFPARHVWWHQRVPPSSPLALMHQVVHCGCFPTSSHRCQTAWVFHPWAWKMPNNIKTIKREKHISSWLHTTYHYIWDTLNQTWFQAAQIMKETTMSMDEALVYGLPGTDGNHYSSTGLDFLTKPVYAEQRWTSRI